MNLESSLMPYESPKDSPEKVVLAATPAVFRSIRYYEFEIQPPKNLLEQLALVAKDPNQNLTLNLFEGLMAYHERLTYDHSIEVGVMSWAMGSLLGLDPEKCFQLGLLHDIGKLVVNANTLSFRFLLNFNQIWNEAHTELVPFHYQVTPEEHELMRLHGVFGGMILKHLGFEPIFQQIAYAHGLNQLTFKDSDSMELMVVTLADWFSAIKDFHRNQHRRTDWVSLDKAMAKIEAVFTEAATCNLPEPVKQAFRDMVNDFKIYPPAAGEPGQILYWYQRH